MEKNELIRLIRQNLEGGRLPCGRAHQLAAEHGVKLQEIGRICDEEKIKITGCQLGCF